MLTTKLQSTLLLLAILASATLFSCTQDQSVDHEPEGPVVASYDVGIVTWIGYGPLFIAKERGLFEKHGINVNLRVLDGPGEREAAYLSGNIDFFPNTPDAFAIFASRGHAGTMVMPMDESHGADGVVAIQEIESIEDLRGKRVGFQSGITSHFFLLYLLDEAGLAAGDVQQENLGAGEAGAAFVAGQLDAAVTWEPWLTRARELPEGHVLATTQDTPGLLADVLMVRPEILASSRDDVLAFMNSWFEAIDYLAENQAKSRQIIARELSIPEGEIDQMLRDVRFFGPRESLEYFGVTQVETSTTRPTVRTVFERAARLYEQAGVIEELPKVEGLIDPSLLRELVEKE